MRSAEWGMRNEKKERTSNGRHAKQSQLAVVCPSGHEETPYGVTTNGHSVRNKANSQGRWRGRAIMQDKANWPGPASPDIGEPPVVRNKANSGAGGPWDCGVQIAECGLKSGMAHRRACGRRAKQSQFSAGGVWGRV